MAPPPLVDPSLLSPQLVATCVELYPELLKEVYQQTRPKLNQAKILNEDEWRYDFAGEAKPGDGLSKAQLLRLVQWKITHGIHRPFLPGMVQKNSEDEVTACATAAAETVSKLDRSQTKQVITATITSALAEICKLKGVGPATGTLVLSVFSPDLVPFFQDETFYWFNSDQSGKLKYDKKEYATLLGQTLDVILDQEVSAQHLEKTAYVLMHANELTEDQKQQIKTVGSQDSQHMPQLNTKSKLPETKPFPLDAKKRSVDDTADKVLTSDNPDSNAKTHDSNPRRSKRRKQ